MVSSYLICDVCGRFGPPAGFLSQNGLRLCYQCWFEEQQDLQPSAPEQGTASSEAPDKARAYSKPPSQG
ncbi:MAG: hypothetical protein IPP10_13240 [Candidatus Competibacteraceae bacterium]|jgi:hypothetical protein|nr:hypothetical protein [Candidatus Competibacteraceae bacterium]MBK7984782.1 hypothetical protein [Candidatus Competibacteraceae bacterium]MBK8899452.1 hypothetical protein [Candidatus Competibacteraceae bacterium]MBK8964457.1 hypothetical protein [Candidatus Competibacteraceae bacterium]MBK9952446.1 hypothetical protein [Candidatus Competibacteraceae bacterium]